MIKYLVAPLALLVVAGCDVDDKSSDARMNQMQETVSAEGVSEVGMPAITNFQRRRTMKQIVEMLDQGISTYTYTRDYNGRFHWYCNSVGFPIPAATQFTNPSKVASRSCPGQGCAIAAIPQADPDTLFAPSASEGTYILCQDPRPGHPAGIKPAYVEDRISTVQWPLPGAINDGDVPIEPALPNGPVQSAPRHVPVAPPRPAPTH